MEEEIYKINNISVNQSKTEFCFCHNNGIKTYDLENFKEKNSSSNFEFNLGGSISLALFLETENNLIFVGSKNNMNYPNNKVVFFDISEKKELFSEKFDKEITNIKYVRNFLFICFSTELKIYLYEKNRLELKYENPLDEGYKNLFEVWETKEENTLVSKIYLAYPFKNQLIILYKTSNDWKLGEKKNIDSPVKRIQNLFYVKNKDLIFISDENAIYLYGIDVNDKSIKVCLERGSKPGFINSITLLNNNFIAINNLDRTIHIFDLDINHNVFSFSNIVNKYIYGLQVIYPCIRIHFYDLVQEKEGQYLKTDFEKKGALLVSEDDANELDVISYNGFAYKIKVNFNDKKYEVIKKENYVEDKNTINLTLTCSYCSFDEKKKEDEK